MNRWNGKVAVVTGASSGIGAAISEKLVQAGMQVVGLARRSDRVETLSKNLSNHPGKLYAVKTDIRLESEIQNAFKWIAENVGPVHVLVNSAGISVSTNLADGETTKWRSVFDTNVLGLCIATREAIRVMKENEIDGHIVNVNSIGGHRVIFLPNVTNVYGASKFAMTNLTCMLRQELNSTGSRIKVTSLSPGTTDTPFLDTVLAGFEEEIRKSIPKLRPEDVADAAMYILGTPPAVQISELIIKPVGETL